MTSLHESNVGHCLQSIEEHQDVVTCLAISKSGGVLVSGSRDTTVMVSEGRIRLHSLFFVVDERGDDLMNDERCMMSDESFMSVCVCVFFIVYRFGKSLPRRTWVI